MPDLKSDREPPKQIRDALSQFTSVTVLLRQNTHVHIYSHTQSVWNKNFLQGETQGEQKPQGLLWALEELTIHIFINVNKAQLVFSSRKRDTREEMVMDGLHDFFFLLHLKHRNSFSVLDFGWIVLVLRVLLCRSHYQTFGSNIFSTSEYRSLFPPPCFSLPSYYTDCMQN